MHYSSILLIIQTQKELISNENVPLTFSSCMLVARRLHVRFHGLVVNVTVHFRFNLIPASIIGKCNSPWRSWNSPVLKLTRVHECRFLAHAEKTTRQSDLLSLHPAIIFESP